MNAEVLIPLAPFLMVAAIVGFVMWSGVARKRAVMDTVKEALRSGQQLSPEVIEALGAKDNNNDKDSGAGDLKGGLILLAVAAGLIVLGLALSPTVSISDPDAPNFLLLMSAVASFPGFIGAVLVLFGLGKLVFARREKKEA